MDRLTEAEIAEAKRRLAETESLYHPDPSLFDPLFETGELRRFSRQEVIMTPGTMLRDVYIIIDGLVGATYISGSKIRMHGFAMPGTMLIHGGSFFRTSEPMMQWEALVPTRAVRVPDSFIRSYMESSHEFAIWMFGMSENNMMLAEERAMILADSAEKQYLKLARIVPLEIFMQLSSRLIARYLGITEQSLSRIRRTLLETGQL